MAKQYLLHSWNTSKIEKYLKEKIISKAIFNAKNVKIEFADIIGFKTIDYVLEDIEFNEDDNGNAI